MPVSHPAGLGRSANGTQRAHHHWECVAMRKIYCVCLFCNNMVYNNDCVEAHFVRVTHIAVRLRLYLSVRGLQEVFL